MKNNKKAPKTRKRVSPAPANALSQQFRYFVCSPAGTWDPSIPIAASRAGEIGLLDLTRLDDISRVGWAIDRLNRLGSEGKGLVVHACSGKVERAARASVTDLEVVLLVPDPSTGSIEVVRMWKEVARQVGIVVTRLEELEWARHPEVDFVVAKGHEAGGNVGEETTFVLLQRLLAVQFQKPVVAWGGIGSHTAAACRIAGVAGVVLDWQLSLMRESPLPAAMRRRIARMDGSETAVVPGPIGRQLRLYDQPGMSAKKHLEAVGDTPGEAPGNGRRTTSWDETINTLMAAPDVEDRLWLIGQDACWASTWVEQTPTVGRTLAKLREDVDRIVKQCLDYQSLARSGPLARSHGTEFPVVQGPMTRVSDVPEFCDAVARGGGLPFLALALMRGEEARSILTRTRDLLGDQPWGVGMLGFVPLELREEQFALIEDIRPPFAIIAGGRPDQAALLEAKGIRTYLHVPSPAMLNVFLKEGARRFIFEGRECGGHVGPRSSFVLWETMTRVLTEADLSEEEASQVHVLFAGGIYDGLSGAMISALGQPLAERGMKIGVVIGTAYLFTKEAVSTGAILEQYQGVALDANRTVVIETGPGHAVRCAPNPYTDAFESQKAKLKCEGKSAEEIRGELDSANIGRLRIASKGIKHTAHRPRAVNRSFERVPGDEQLREGMYMIGQVAPLCGATCAIQQLHERVFDGTTVQLALARAELASVKPSATARPSPPPLNIAIVGMSCLLPGAETPCEFWQNILEKRDLLDRVPADRFDVDRWYDPDRGARDKIYAASGGFLKDVPFDPLKFGIPPTSLRSIEPVQLLALELVDRALRDVGYGGFHFDNRLKERTSIILGSGGGGSELSMKHVFRAALPQYFTECDESLLSELPEWNEDSFAGILVNVIAGRIANRFDLGGVNFTVDAACASSLAAIYLACRELTDGTSDLVIAGGCDTSQTPFGYFCFSSAGALSPRGKSRTFDASADGIAISEGLAAVVLKRVEDAERDGDRIYAVLRAVAGGSDGRSMGMTAPRSEGQVRTLERAYEQARFSPASVELFEAHGTGTAVGDTTECQALAEMLREHDAPSRKIAIGSVKSNIGHTKGTAGVAGMMKAALALHHNVLPPTINVESLDPDGPLVDGPLYANTELRPWVRSDSPRRAAVSAFGFGGTNFHAVLEEYEGNVLESRATTAHRCWPAEVFLFAGKSKSELADRVRRFGDEIEAARTGGAELALSDLAFTLYGRVNHRATVRAAVVATDVIDLVKRLMVLSQTLSVPKASRATLSEGVYFVEEPLAVGASLAMLFPGQGSQFPNMLRDLAVEFSECRGCFDRIDTVVCGEFDRPLSRFVFPVPAFSPREKSSQVELLKATDVTQPALGASMLAVLRLLESLEIHPQFTAGHSFGELVALHAAGCLDESSLGRLSQVRGCAMANIGRERSDRDLGSMVAVCGDENAVRSLIEQCSGVSIANLNSPRQTVISGSTSGLARAVEVLEAAELLCMPIPVACAFHTSVMEPAKEIFEEALRNTVVRSPHMPVFADSSASPYPETPDAIRRVLAEQILSPVRFVELIENMYQAGSRVFLEVGPNEVLSRLVGDILLDRPHVTIATQPRDEHGVTGMLKSLGQLFVHGVSMNLERLYAPRQLQTLDLGELAGGTETKPDPHVWLVNGAYARPANEPRRNEQAKFAAVRPDKGPVATTPKAEDATPAVPVAASSAFEGNEVEDPYGQFQETMREFLRTQEAVMTSFFGAGSLPVPDEHGRAELHVLPDDVQTVAEPAAVEPATAEPRATEPRVIGPDTPSRGESRDLDAVLQEIVSERTGYPPDMLEFDINLEAELGIDSIKRVEIIAAFRRTALPSMDEPPLEFMERMAAAKTMREIVDGVRELTVAPASSDPGEETPKPVAAKAGPEEPSSEPVLRYGVEVVEAPLDDGSDVRQPEGVVVITDDGHGIAKSLADELVGANVEILSVKSLVSCASASEAIEEIRRQHGNIAGLFHLQALQPAPPFPLIDQQQWASHTDAEVKSALYLLQAMAPELNQGTFFACASCGGGDFDARGGGEAAHPWRGGLTGMLKCAAKEWPQSRFRVIDLDAPTNDSLTRILLQEWESEGPVEVGYRNDRRLVVRPVLSELDETDEAFSSLIDADSVVLVTGGARGITAQIAIELALQAQPTLILLGRSARPTGPEAQATAGISDPNEIRKVLVAQAREDGSKVSPKEIESKLRTILAEREIRGTLAAISEAGGTVRYMPCDVRDPVAIERVVAEVQGQFGPISVVVHGAGVLDDKTIVDKTSESFDYVVETKITPILTLARTLDPSQVKLFMLFSSVAGFFGNPGQSDYAAANETLNRMARRLSRLWPGKTVAMNWGPWVGAGMVTSEVARQFVSRGVGLIAVPEGRRAAWLETSPNSMDDVRVLFGSAGAWPDVSKEEPSARKRIVLQTPLLADGVLKSGPGDTFELHRTLDPDRHPYFIDHKIDGTPVLPFMFALESMAEMAAAIRPDWHVTQVAGIRQFKGVLLERQHDIFLRGTLVRQSESSSQWLVRIFDSKQPSRPCYEATAVLSTIENEPPAPPSLVPIRGAFPLSLEHAYEEWLFHGPVFQAIERIGGCNEDGIDASVQPSSTRRCVGHDSEVGWLIDPIVLDVGPQLAILWSRAIYGTTTLPNRMEAYERYGSFQEGPIDVAVRVNDTADAQTFKADVWFIHDGTVVGVMRGLEGASSASLNRVAEDRRLTSVTKLVP